ncbi:MAG TPA: hypothetical protein VK596_04180 [Edaphobacter sp.]|nr:hypothetical protein [Edaphobacter sp.]
MSDTKPQQNILSSLSATEAENLAAISATPTVEPPEELTSIKLVRFQAEANISAAQAFSASATVWQYGKKINALWSINENRNSWVGVTGVGWVKLANNNDTAIVALTMLGADAKLTQGTVNYRQESDGMIHEMYVW